MSKRSLYKHLDTHKEIELVKAGQYYIDNNGKVFYEKEIRCMYKFIGYIHDRIVTKNYESYRNVNGFIMRSYKRKPDESIGKA